MKKAIVRILLALVVLVVIAVVVSIFFIGSIVKAGVEKVGPKVAKVPVKLEGANISVFSGSGELKGFVVGNPEGFKTAEALKVGSISLSLVPSTVLKDKVVIRSIKVIGPEITYETDLKGSNLGKLLENVSGSAEQDKQAPTKKEQTTKTKLQVDEFVITGAKVQVAASLLGQSAAQSIPLPEIRLTKLGEGPEGITPAELSKKVLNEVLGETTKAVAGKAGDIGKSVEALGTGATDQLKKGASGILDPFKKKQ